MRIQEHVHSRTSTRARAPRRMPSDRIETLAIVKEKETQHL